MTTPREPQLFGISLTVGRQVGDIVFTRLSKVLLRVEHTELWVPRSFSARIDRAPLPLVELAIVYVQHERFRSESVRVTARDHDSLDAAALRLPVDALMWEGVERAAYRQVELSDRGDVSAARFLLGQQTESSPSRDSLDVRKIRVGDLFRFPVAMMYSDTDRSEYEKGYGAHVRRLLLGADHSRAGAVSHLAVSLEYQRAMAEGEETGFAVAERFGWTRHHANNRIAEARKARYLPPAERGQASTWGTARA